MKALKSFFWNVCDYSTPRHMIVFRLSAIILSILGCNYWIDSIDFESEK